MPQGTTYKKRKDNPMRKHTTIEVHGAKIEIMPRVYSVHDRRSAYSQTPRMYVSVADETLFDNLANRKRRPYNVYKTLIHASGISEILDLSRLSWSQYAGCTCPCSPGFILNRQTVRFEDEVIVNFDVWVTLESAPSVNERKAPRIPAGV
jgi:mevalonate pyrophosphate decarboxylase